MTINPAGAIGRLGAIGVEISAAGAIVTEVLSLVDAAEQLYAELKGSDKFAAVEAGLETVVANLGLTDKFAAIWKALGPFVSLVVTIWNLANLWPHKQPAA